jgi:hypothetical protein
LVTKYTSALTLQVLGNCKGVIAAVVSVFMFKNHVTPRGCLGYAVTVAGVFLYSESKRRGKMARETAAGGAGVGAGGGAAAVGAGGGGAASSASGTGASSGTEAGTATATATGAQFHHPQHVVSGAALLKALVGGKGSDGGVAAGTGAGGGAGAAAASGIAGVLGGFAPMLKGRGVAQGAGAGADVESVALLQGGGGGGAGGAGGAD